MSIPLAFLHGLPTSAPELSLGEHLAAAVTDSGRISTLLDCLPSTDAPALWSSDTTRSPLSHAALRRFVAAFVLPTSGVHHQQFAPNDRVMVVLPTSPENAVALLAVSSYHACAPVNSTCTAGELFDDARRLGAKAVLTTPEAADRLELSRLRDELRCEVVFLHPRADGPAGLFDLSVMGYGASVDAFVEKPSAVPSKLHGLHDQSLVLHTSGTSGKKKVSGFVVTCCAEPLLLTTPQVVPYTLRSLIVGTCAVMHSWELRPDDVNSE